MNEEIEYSSEKISLGVWKKILKLVFKRKKNIIVMIISVLGLGSLDVLFPYLMSKTIEVFFGETPDFNAKYLFIGLFVAIALAYAIVIFLFIYMAGIVEVEVADELTSSKETSAEQSDSADEDEEMDEELLKLFSGYL